MAFQAQNKFFKISPTDEIERGPLARQAIKAVGVLDSVETMKARRWWELYIDEVGTNNGPFYVLQRGPFIVNSVLQRVEQTNTWSDATPEEKRAQLEARIDEQRYIDPIMPMDLAEDPALQGEVDERVAALNSRYLALLNTEDSGLDTFDPVLKVNDAADVDSLVVAATLSAQVKALAQDPTLSAQQVTDLTDAATTYDSVLQAGDPTANVPPVPVFARRQIGIPGEELGLLEIVREQNIPDPNLYCPVFRLRMRRQLQPGEHWLFLGDDTTPLDEMPDLAQGYLTSVQLTEESPGVYVADSVEVNVWRARTFEFRVTLCEGHLTQPRFPVVQLLADQMSGRYRVRYGDGAAPIGGTWQDTGVAVTGIVGGGTYNVGDTAPFEGLAAGTPVRIDDQETTFNRVHASGAPGIIVVDDHYVGAVGHNVWIQV